MCEEFFAQLGRSPLVRVFLPDEERVAHLVRDYGGQDMREGLLAALERLQRRLGSELTQRCRLWIDEGNYADAARAVLHYYDRCYAHQIENRQAPVIKELTCTTDDPALAARSINGNRTCRRKRSPPPHLCNGSRQGGTDDHTCCADHALSAAGRRKAPGQYGPAGPPPA